MSRARDLGNNFDGSKAKVIDAAGDIVYGIENDSASRLAIGTAGQVLQVNSGATAPEWASLTGSAQNFSLLNAGGTALTGAATVTVSGISGINQLLVFVEGASSVNASSIMSLRLNTDSGANYKQSKIEIVASSAYSSSIINSFNLGNPTEIQLGQMGSGVASQVQSSTMLYGCNSTGLKTYMTMGGGNANGNSQRHFWGGGIYDSSSAISSISIISSSGDLDAGTVFVYGSVA
jgi:hypothetical protein